MYIWLCKDEIDRSLALEVRVLIGRDKALSYEAVACHEAGSRGTKTVEVSLRSQLTLPLLRLACRSKPLPITHVYDCYWLKYTEIP